MVSKVMFTSNTCEWSTPQDLFDKLNSEFNFELDVCASKDNHKCERYFTKEDDAFLNKWTGRVWCNPPYGRDIARWVEACANHSNISVMLLPARTDTKWFHKFIYNNPNAKIRFIKGRLKFNNAKNPAPFPSMIVIFNDDIIEA